MAYPMPVRDWSLGAYSELSGRQVPCAQILVEPCRCPVWVASQHLALRGPSTQAERVPDSEAET